MKKNGIDPYIECDIFVRSCSRYINSYLKLNYLNKYSQKHASMENKGPFDILTINQNLWQCTGYSSPQIEHE